MLRSFVRVNKRASNQLARWMPHTAPALSVLYEETVAQYMQSTRAHVIVDIGGGKVCHVRKYLRPDDNIRLIAVDVSEEAMAGNNDVDGKRVVDVVGDELPFADEEVDMLISRQVIEHLRDVERFVSKSARVLKPGGYSIHLFSGRFSPFALINQVLSEGLSRRILFYLKPAAIGTSGYPAFYDKCYYSAIKGVFERSGFAVQDIVVGYHSSYFGFFLPIFLVNCIYELFLYALGAKNLGSRLLLVARKPPTCTQT